jgi:hypothetical protein
MTTDYTALLSKLDSFEPDEPEGVLCRHAAKALRDLRAKLAEAERALRAYGMHTNDCPRNLSQPNCDWDMGCTCGYDAALDTGEKTHDRNCPAQVGDYPCTCANITP